MVVRTLRKEQLPILIVLKESSTEGMVDVMTDVEGPGDTSELQAQVLLPPSAQRRGRHCERVRLKIEAVLAENPEGVTDEEMRQKTPDATPIQRQEAVNALLTGGRLSLSQMGKMLVYRPRNPAAAARLSGATAEETVVYQLVEEARATGIWIKDIRTRSGLAQTQLNKILKGLESKKMIKCIRAVGSVRRKMYVLYDITPDEAIAGGVFFTDQELDHQFADLLAQQCVKFLGQRGEMANARFPDQPLARRRQSFTPASAVRQHIDELEISKVKLSGEDVERVLETLVWDGRAEKGPESGGGGGPRYRLTRPLPNTGLPRSPCSFCPLVSDCAPRRAINPANCHYFKEWLPNQAMDEL